MIVQTCIYTSPYTGKEMEFPECDGYVESSDYWDRVFMLPCGGVHVDAGIVNGRAPFAVRTTSSNDDLNDLPF